MGYSPAGCWGWDIGSGSALGSGENFREYGVGLYKQGDGPGVRWPAFYHCVTLTGKQGQHIMNPEF